ncbi:DUF6291 domain-containing protein [Chryseobacterium sp.]|uniref:DUF6291 domain-containing protein n=1 Tax=Chryseobacterium sp. TaxID=1871047 RepID=UPI00321A1C7F
MESKKSFLIYNDLKLTLDKLPNDLAGELFKMIINFANDESPTTENLIVDIAFCQVKAQMIRDSQSWSEKSKERSYNGRMGNLKKHHEDLYNSVKEGLMTLEKAEATAKDRIAENNTANAAVTDTVNGTVTGTVKGTGKPYKSPTDFSFYKSLISIGAESKLANEWLAVRKKKKATDTETAFDGFVREMNKGGLDINSTLRICIEKSWSGLKASWLENEKPKQESTPTRRNPNITMF